MTTTIGIDSEVRALARAPRVPPTPEAHANRVSRWAAVVYVVVALATPLLLYSGPDVLPPAAPAIAEAALDGHLSLHAHLAHASDARATDVR